LKCKNNGLIFGAIFSAWLGLAGGPASVLACGPDFPNTLLDVGDKAVLTAPVADFERELERMKLAPPKVRAVPLAAGQRYYEQATEIEMADLDQALKQSGISRELKAAVLQAHLAERMKLNAFLQAQERRERNTTWIYDEQGAHIVPATNPPPSFPEIVVTPGLPTEFALYFWGAVEWSQDRQWQSTESWQQLLELPPAKRHYKSTWAAYMLAKRSATETNEWDDREALKYYALIRAQVKEGFADSLGLATASLGDEARIWLRRRHYEQALELYLDQYAAGDDSAVQSLRFTAARLLAETNQVSDQLPALALNSRTRRVITAYLISRHFPNSYYDEDINVQLKTYNDRAVAWLEAVEAAGVKDVEAASSLALAAYQAGDMELAQRWVNRAGHEPVAEWLQAKLDLRAGKISEAAKRLTKLTRKFPQAINNTDRATGLAGSLSVSRYEFGSGDVAAGQQAYGELGVLHLARREYTEALDALLRSGYWQDAAYVAERVLTTAELKTYVDRTWPETRKKIESDISESRWYAFSAGSHPEDAIRYLLARRLARDASGQQAMAYYPTNLRGSYGQYLQDLKLGRNVTNPPALRAEKLFAAAFMARTNGLELFGTELEPDWAIYGADFELSAYGSIRATNAAGAKINRADTNELARATVSAAHPNERFHYRYQAAELAWEAAGLLPNNTEETARVLCTGGSWLKNRDPQAADRFYKELVRRCRHTAIGDLADRMRWFPELDALGQIEPLWVERVEVDPYLLESVATNGAGVVYSTALPVPGRHYALHGGEDLPVIVRAVRRLGGAVEVSDLLQANPGLDPAHLKIGQLIYIPPMTNNPVIAPDIIPPDNSPGSRP
jgi:hypothetical protein